MSPSEAELAAYLTRPKFRDPEAWLRRGLNPSSEQEIERMELLVNEVCAAGLDAVRKGCTSKQVGASLVRALRRHKGRTFDTEDREFIADEVNEVGRIAGVRLGSALNSWMYGFLLGLFINRDKRKNER